MSTRFSYGQQSAAAIAALNAMDDDVQTVIANSKPDVVDVVGVSVTLCNAFKAVVVASSVNFLLATPAIATGTPSLIFTGTDTNVAGIVATKGTGGFSVNTNGTVTQFKVADTASAVNWAQATGAATTGYVSYGSGGSDASIGVKVVSKALGSFVFQDDTGSRGLQVSPAASGVNYTQANGASTGNVPLVYLTGTDAAVNGGVSSKGTGGVGIYTNGAAQLQFKVAHTASAVNYPTVTGGSTGNGVSLSAAGSDANIDFNITPKGSGVFAVTGASTVTANTSMAALKITQTGAGNALVVEDSASTDSTPFVIDASGNVVVGHTAVLAGGFADTANLYNVKLAIPRFFQMGYTADAFGPVVEMSKSRGASVGAHSVVANNDQLGTMRFAGDDGTAYIVGAEIRAYVDGTPGTNDMPGRLVFSTTADGASSPTEAMRIDSKQAVGIGATPTSGDTVRIGKVLTGNTTVNGVNNLGSVQSDVTTRAISFNSFASTQAATFTLPEYIHYRANQGTLGAGSTVTNQYGFFVEGALTGATNNYAFYGNIAAGTGRWNFFANGTAQNAFSGNTRIGSTVAPTVALDVTGAAIISGQVSLGGITGAEALRAVVTASSVNYWSIAGNIAGAGIRPIMLTEGSDTGISTHFATKGSGNHLFSTFGTTPQLVISHTASAVNYLQATGGAAGNFVQIQAQGTDAVVAIASSTKGTGTHRLYTGGGLQVVVADTASAVNWVQATGAVTGGDVIVSAQGSDSAVAFNANAKGNQYVKFYANSALQLAVSPTASAVNYSQLTGAVTAGAAQLSAQGSDANVTSAYVSKGTGSHTFWSNGAAQFMVVGVASAVNYLQNAGAATGNSPNTSSAGPDAAINITVLAKAGGGIYLQNNSASQVRVLGPASTVNYLNFAGSTTGTDVVISTGGSDADRGITITTAGIGVISLNGTVKSIGRERNTSKEKDTTASLTAKTITARRTYLTGAAGASLAITLPAISATIDGQIHTIMSTAARASTTWESSGATFVGLPASLTANVPVTLQYHHATTEWFVC